MDSCRSKNLKTSVIGCTKTIEFIPEVSITFTIFTIFLLAFPFMHLEFCFSVVHVQPVWIHFWFIWFKFFLLRLTLLTSLLRHTRPSHLWMVSLHMDLIWSVEATLLIWSRVDFPPESTSLLEWLMEGTSGPMTLLLLSLPCRVLRVLWTKVFIKHVLSQLRLTSENVKTDDKWECWDCWSLPCFHW